MKSLLVDALRQANEGEKDQALSDSGSFDTTAAEFSKTANDPTAALELFETSISVPPAAATDYEFSDTDIEEAQQPIPRQANREDDSAYVATTPQSGLPALARFAPVICIVAALVGAASWSALQHFEPRFDGMMIVGSQSGESVLETQYNTTSADAATAERFPFVDIESPSQRQETAE